MKTATNETITRKYNFPAIEISLLLVAAFWGASYGVTKMALVFTSVFMLMAIRFSLTFAFLLYPTLKDFRANKNKDWKVAIPTGVILLAIFFCEIVGVAHTTATNAVFLISLTVIMTALVEAFVNKQKVNKLLFALSVVSVAGIYLLTNQNQIAITLNLGDILILLAAFLRALMVTFTKLFTQNKQITTTSLTALQSLVVAVGALILLFFQEDKFSIPTDISFWYLILFLVLFCTLFAFFVQNNAVRKTSPTKVSLLMGSEPLFGALFAFAWLGETLSFTQLIGAFLIALSVSIASIRRG